MEDFEMSEMQVNNVSWDRTSSRADIDRAAGRIVTAVEKGTNRVVDESKKITTAVRDGSKKVADAVKTNNAEQSVAPTPARKALYEGLQGIAASTTRIADSILVPAKDVKATLESAEKISRQYADVVDRASRSAECLGELRETVGEVTETSRWLAGELNDGCNRCVPVGNLFGRVSDFS